MSQLIERLILYLALIAFALYGITHGAPAVARVVSAHLERAARAGDTR